MAKPTQEEIDNQRNDALSWEDAGGTAYPGMTYEQGVGAALAWMEGDSDERPIQELPEVKEEDESSEDDED
jgi:hypothetical protein